MTAIKHNANASLRIHCTYIANCQRTSLLIGAMRQATIPAAMHESPGGRGLLMREWRAIAAHCNCPLVQSSIQCQPLPVLGRICQFRLCYRIGMAFAYLAIPASVC